MYRINNVYVITLVNTLKNNNKINVYNHVFLTRYSAYECFLGAKKLIEEQLSNKDSCLSINVNSKRLDAFYGIPDKIYVELKRKQLCGTYYRHDSDDDVNKIQGEW